MCTTELGEFARLKGEFDRRCVKVIGLSVDPLDGHLRWSVDIEETQGYAPNFPLIADPDREVSDLYGMIHPNASDTTTVRSVFVIGPDKKVKLMITYPQSTGRNFTEVLRVIDSLQLTAHHMVSTPVNWTQGDDVIILPSISDEEARKRFRDTGWTALGMVLYGHGQASNLLARYAAADLAPDDQRGRAISTLVFASTFGAIAGPALIGAGKWLGRELGLDELAGPYVFAAVFFAVATLNTAVRLRPDPLVVAGGLDPDPASRRIDLRTPLRIVRGGLARPSRVRIDGGLAGRDGRGDDDDAPAHEGPRPLDRARRRGAVVPHRRHVRARTARRASDRRGRVPVIADRCDGARRGLHRQPPSPVTSRCCCSRRCGRSAWGGAAG